MPMRWDGRVPLPTGQYGKTLLILSLVTNNISYNHAGLEFYRGNCRRGRTKCRGSLRQRWQFFAV
jgi:hypothetical protein